MRGTDFEKILSSLSKWGIDPTIQKLSEFYDEPKFYGYNARLRINRKLRKEYSIGKEISAGTGLSNDSSEQAFYKCVFEALERFCLECYKKDSVFESKAESSEFIDLSPFSKNPDIKNKKIGWIEGSNLMSGKKVFLPAQLVHYIYKRKEHEPRLDFPLISTGAAGGSSAKQALINGIYEVIERDSLMSVYLAQITPPRVDLADMNNPIVNYILESCKKYNLEIYVMNVTTDLQIPTFISVMIDRTGVGPAVALGAKSSLRTFDAIVGAISESLLTRISLRLKAVRGDLVLAEKMEGKDAVLKRAAFWFDPTMIKHIKFLTSGPLVKIKNKKYENLNQELNEVIGIIKSLRLNAYYANIAFEGFERLGVYVYKVLIPGLQPLYLNEWEKDRVVNLERLKRVSASFGVKFKQVNPISHPFL